jgi:hypothetical protein
LFNLHQGERALDKAEAITVLREISTVCPEMGYVDFVSLDPDDSKGSYKIRMKTSFGCQSTECMQKILDARKLKMTQKKDLTIIYRPIV